jgi:two-component system nitrogen regulation response regulator NtrX
LRERREDIPGLCRIFLAACLEANRLEPKTLDPALLEEFRTRDWPGNIRELKNTVERLAITTPGPVIRSDPEAPEGGRGRPGPLSVPDGGGAVEGWFDFPYREAKAEFEKRYFRHQLDAHDWNVTRTAEAANLDRSTIHKKLNELDIKPPPEPRPEAKAADGRNGL